jgi:outer membrane lipoprotein-sorting protein
MPKPKHETAAGPLSPARHYITTCFAVLFSLFGAVAALASADTDKGLAIAIEADRRDNGFGDTAVDLTMLIASSAGSVTTREMRQMVLEVAGDGDKSIMVFDRPRDLKGTAILTFTHKLEDDEQWLYLPALKRVKRISSADKSGPFMGSEFAYEDLSSQEVEKYSYRYLRDETVNGEPCFVVERIPTDKNSGYTRQIIWVDQAEYRLQRVDYYDRKNTLLKSMSPVNYQQYLNLYWRPAEMIMTNHQTGKSTTLKFGNYQFQTGLQDSDFTPSAISRIR